MISGPYKRVINGVAQSVTSCPATAKNAIKIVGFIMFKWGYYLMTEDIILSIRAANASG